MAEFAEVMRQWVRVRKATASSAEERVLSVYSLEEYDSALIASIEKNVMSWAAEHPEPVYPTWGEWLHDLGLIVQKEGTFTEYGPNEIFSAIKKVDVLTIKGYQSIPADIASKLGIQPKEAKE